MLDRHGRTIKPNDLILGSFYGQGGWWYDYAIARHSFDKGFWLEFERGDKGDFSHPKFCCEDRRRVVDPEDGSWADRHGANHYRYAGLNTNDAEDDANERLRQATEITINIDDEVILVKNRPTKEAKNDN